MPKFTITIDCDSAAFDDGNFQYELSRLLEEAADRIMGLQYDFVLHDINGRPVGVAVFIEDE